MKQDNPISFYQENGFYIARDILNKQNILSVLKHVNELFSTNLEYRNIKPKTFKSEQDLFQNMISLFRADQSAYLASAKLCAKLPSFQQLALSDSLQNIALGLGLKSLVIPTESIFHIMSQSLKADNGYLGFDPHQDWTSMQGSLNSVSIWAPFTNITESSFPLQVIPGSHKKGLLQSLCDNSAADTAVSQIGGDQTKINENLYHESDFVSVILQPGDAVLISSWLIHRTGITIPAQDRISMSVRFEDTRDTSWIERNYPSAYQRSVIRGLITKNFPSIEQIKESIRND